MNQVGKHLRQVTGAVLVTLMLSACTESMDDLEKYVVAVKAKPAKPIEPVPSVVIYPSYEYTSTNRDPFSKFMDDTEKQESPTKSTGPQPDFDRSREYLERYELDTLAMVGTFRKEQSYWALLRDPEGVIHRVPVGDFIGKNHGEVVDISDVQVDLSELISDGTGGWIVREASIALGDG